jgi:hypothetical protein
MIAQRGHLESSVVKVLAFDVYNHFSTPPARGGLVPDAESFVEMRRAKQLKHVLILAAMGRPWSPHRPS